MSMSNLSLIDFFRTLGKFGLIEFMLVRGGRPELGMREAPIVLAQNVRARRRFRRLVFKTSLSGSLNRPFVLH